MSLLEDLLALQMRAVQLPKPDREVTLVPGRRFRFDFVWPEHHLALEVDGGEWIAGRHQRPTGFRADAEKFSLAAVHGWRVMRCTGSMVEDGTCLKLIEQAMKGRTNDV